MSEKKIVIVGGIHSHPIAPMILSEALSSNGIPVHVLEKEEDKKRFAEEQHSHDILLRTFEEEYKKTENAILEDESNPYYNKFRKTKGNRKKGGFK